MIAADQDANGNGDPNDEYPININLKYGQGQPLDFAALWGLPITNSIFYKIDENGNVTHAVDTQAFRDFLTYFYQLGQEGLLNQLKREMDLTILFIAHNLSVVKYFSDRIGVMYFGKLVELAPSEELFKNPMHPYTKALFSAIPLPNPRTERSRRKTDYDPQIHQYTPQDVLGYHEITPGHLVYGTDAEAQAYLKMLR